MSSRSRVEQPRAGSVERRRPEPCSSSSSRPGTPRPRSSAAFSPVRSSQPVRSSSSKSPFQVDSILKNTTSSGGIRGKSSTLDHTLKPVANGVLQQRISPKIERKPTPTRRAPTAAAAATSDQAENARPVESTGFRWPASNSPGAISVSRSVDLSSPMAVQGRAFSRTPKQSPSSGTRSPKLNEGTPDVRNRTPKPAISSPSPKPIKTPAVRSRSPKPTSAARAANESVTPSPKPPPPPPPPPTTPVPRYTPSPVRRSRPHPVPTSDAVSESDILLDDSSSASTKKTPFFRPRPTTEPPSTDGKTPSRRPRSLTIGVNGNGSSPGGTPWSLSPGRLSTTPTQPPSPSRSLQGSSPSFRGSSPSPTSSSGSGKASPFQLSFAGTMSNLLNLEAYSSRKGRKAISQLEEAHLLRVLHNRWLQWRYVNAKTNISRTSQNQAAERLLYNAWMRTSELRKSVAMCRIRVEQERGAGKLQRMLSLQGPHLETWSAIQQQHSAALCGAMDALEAAVLRVPVTGGARADVRGIREALGVAVDVMASVESLVVATLLTPKTERTKEVVAELADVSKRETAVLEECSCLLDRIAALETEERSLLTHSVQRECELRRIV